MNEDVEILENELNSTNQRWRDLQRGICERLHAADQVEHELADFKECVETLQASVREVINSVRDVDVLDVPEGEEVNIEEICVKPRLSKPEKANKDVDVLQVSCKNVWSTSIHLYIQEKGKKKLISFSIKLVKLSLSCPGLTRARVCTRFCPLVCPSQTGAKVNDRVD